MTTPDTIILCVSIVLLIAPLAYLAIAAALLVRAAIFAPRKCRHCDELCASGQTLCPACKARQDDPFQGMKL